jgi:hypothetical protein
MLRQFKDIDGADCYVASGLPVSMFCLRVTVTGDAVTRPTCPQDRGLLQYYP